MESNTVQVDNNQGQKKVSSVTVIPPVNPLQETSVSQSGITPSQGKRKYFLFFIFVLFLVSLCAFCLSFAIAYEKISLGKPSLEKKVRNVILNFPFVPKTPRYLLETSALAHQKMSKHHFDVSLAVDSNALTPFFGLSKTDVQVKGEVDFTDPKNLITSLTGSLGNDFNVELRKKDAVIYFKINKLPSFFWVSLALDENKLSAILENWISYDTKSLETEARKYLDEKSSQQSITKGIIEESIDHFLDKKLLKEISVSKEKLDGISTYKLYLTGSDEIVDYLGEKLKQEAKSKDEWKLSEFIKDLEVELWIGNKNKYLRKIAASFKVIQKKPISGYPQGFIPSLLLDSSEILVSAVTQFDKFGEPIVVEIPSKSLTIEEIYKLIEEMAQEKYPSPKSAP